MTSERQETEETFEAWYERLRRERGGAAGPLDAMDADATQMLLAAYYDRATPRAGEEEREVMGDIALDGFIDWCDLDPTDASRSASALAREYLALRQQSRTAALGRMP